MKTTKTLFLVTIVETHFHFPGENTETREHRIVWAKNEDEARALVMEIGWKPQNIESVSAAIGSPF